MNFEGVVSLKYNNRNQSCCELITVIPVMTYVSSLLFRVVKATYLGDIFCEVAEITAPYTWDIGVK